jgi:iron complex transport system permease protein
MTTAADLKRLYHKGKKRKVLAIISIFILLFLVFVFSLSFGAGSPQFNEAFAVIVNKIFPSLNFNPQSEITQIIILDVRLPRIILAIIAGVGLATAGSTMQGILKNPLVSPYLLGISAAAGFGASLALVFGIGFVTAYGGYLVIVNSFVFSLLAMLVVYVFARMRGMHIETVILAGVAVSYLFSALTSLLQYLSPHSQAVRDVVFWLMGGLDIALWENILLILPVVAVSVILMMSQSWNINVMSMGEDVAKSLGVNTQRVLATCMLLASLVTATIIAFTGVIGFIGLVAPHVARMLIGNDHRFLLPCSAVIGSFILLCSDTVGRLVLAPSEIPVGIVTSLLGVPFFVYFMMRRRRRTWR